MRRLRLGMAQINTTVGDFVGNTEKIVKSITEARVLGVDLVTFPELAICGYPPEDLLFKPQFIEENSKALQAVIGCSSGITIIVGFVDAKEDIYNAAAIIHDGKLVDIYHKIFLPNYGVFDENRYFRAGSESPVYIIAGAGVGVNICEDIWYEVGPATIQAYAGAEVIINISSSPYHFGKGKLREKMLAARSSDNVAIVAYNNLVGGQDELVFDGNSLILDEKGQLVARGKQFAEDLIVVDLNVESVFRTRLHDPRWRKGMPIIGEQDWSQNKIMVSEIPAEGPKSSLPRRQIQVRGLPGEVYDALVVGTHDYIFKNGFNKVLIGLSGGVDSSLVAAIAVEALGKASVVGVAMPSRHSSPESLADAKLLAQNLGIELLVIPIEKVFQAYLETLSEVFAGTKPGAAEENIQARIRGNLLMALSNKFGWLVLATGNKSEMATGYTTLYGDMAGGFAVIKDVPKTLVYQLVKYCNVQAGYDLIPVTVIQKPPSAELRPNQKDTDTLPPYEVLDAVLTAYIEEDKNVEQIIAMGIDEEAVKRSARLVDTSEYKRRQSPPGIKITLRAFGRDRRLPITNRFAG
ncbi:MAG: NAD+ synthase [Dehalococcoidales bacterium]|jgi:NAD+ synthase (glutamine-hydrolysing)|nr:NAD+ synthase [Dehalococcoidales bacterium]MDP6738278.1 NAD+ synthase [Dehalococcoidales bacterium]|tara:strand:- start:623 stop:2356 length:1734 start_codon:yes stop_codon:yes gene_type:complete